MGKECELLVCERAEGVRSWGQCVLCAELAPYHWPTARKKWQYHSSPPSGEGSVEPVQGHIPLF